MTNLQMLSLAARGFGPLREDIVFVGGATIELYLTGQPALKIRPTDDVDCVVEVASKVEYYKLEEKLRDLGFTHVVGEGVHICRWRYQDVLVDVMPVEGGVLGFSNRWYPGGFATAIPVRLADGQDIRVFDLPHLVASKIEAFMGRGNNDFVGSSDMEDLVTIIDGVADFQEKIAAAPAGVLEFLRERFAGFIRDERFRDSLEGHLPLVGRVERVARVLRMLETLAEGAP